MTSMSQLFESVIAGAGVDLGQQAPVAADAARQHRGGVVDHHGGRADHRRQRRGDRRHRVGPRRRLVHHPAHGHHAERGRLRAACATTRWSRSTTPRRSSASATSIAVGDGAGADQTRVAYRDEELESVQVQGVSEEYLDFATFDAERGRMISRSRSRASGRSR